jgi:hypothetical protein
MFDASAAGARTGGIEHWTCSHCSRMHLEEATPIPDQAFSAEPGPMDVDVETEQSPTGLNASHQAQNIVHVEEEIIQVSSLPPAIQAPLPPAFSPPPTAGATNPTYETPLYLSSFQRHSHFMPDPEVPELSPLLISLFPRVKRPCDYEGIFTRRGARSRARSLLKHLRPPVEPSHPGVRMATGTS